MKIQIVVGAMVLFACEPGPQAVTQGIYAVESTAISDTCSPMRAPGGAITDVEVRGDVVSAMMPVFFGRQRFDIPLGGFSQKRIQPADLCSGATIDLSLDIPHYATPFTVNWKQKFSNVTPGSGGCVSNVPIADCVADYRYQFTLIEACPSACSIREENPLTGKHCVCPDAGK